MDRSKYLAKPDQTIEEHAMNLLKVLSTLEEYNYISDSHLIKQVELACLYHDDGKVNPEFQKRILLHTKFNPEKEIPHNILSGYLLDKNKFDDEEDYYKVLFAIIYHHNYGNPEEIIIDKDKKKLIYELLSDFQIVKIKAKTLNMIQNEVNDMEAVKIKGYLHKCDYSASGRYIAEYPNTFLEKSLENVLLKWKKHNSLSEWNDLQCFAMKKRNDNIIMIAQTGMGKTEAGLQWIGNHKGFFVLPLRTAINAIYDRVRKDVLLNDKVDERLSILHSDSLEYYSKHIENDEINIIEYEKRGKTLSMPLSISTMDQLFDFVFRYQGYELKLVTLGYSKVVIDEIQMYDPELLAYLVYGLKKVVEYGGKVAVMTATLSPFLKELLLKEIKFKEENIRTFTTDLVRHNVKVFETDICVEDITQLYFENMTLDKSNKILVVCNTIKKAQEIYKKILEKIDYRENVHILHSRYIRKDRNLKEQEIIQFGRTFNEKGDIDCQSGIWISTSLVEASLDIDFDYLFTELQDLNSLFQRMGRCNRKGIKDVSHTNCFVYLTSSNEYLDKTIFKLSKNAMMTVEGPLSEKAKMSIIDKYITFENMKDSEYYRGKKGYKSTMDWIKKITPYKFDKDENKLRNILSVNIIPHCVFINQQQELEELENIIMNEESDSTEKIIAKDRIMEYSVNIPLWQWKVYQNAVINNKAERFTPIRLNRYQTIAIMECEYDEMGYRLPDYDKIIREVNFL